MSHHPVQSKLNNNQSVGYRAESLHGSYVLFCYGVHLLNESSTGCLIDKDEYAI